MVSVRVNANIWRVGVCLFGRVLYCIVALPPRNTKQVTLFSFAMIDGKGATVRVRVRVRVRIRVSIGVRIMVRVRVSVRVVVGIRVRFRVMVLVRVAVAMDGGRW